jgi:hypothetical protein
MGTNTYAKVRGWLLALGSIQLLLSLAVGPMFSLAMGYAKLSVLDKYWELYNEGVIDSRMVENVQKGRFVGDWAEIPYYLTEKFDVVKGLAWFMAAFLFATSVLILRIWLQMREVSAHAHREEGSSPPAQRSGPQRNEP